MVCPRHGVSVGSCSHDVDMTPPEETTPVKDEDDLDSVVDRVVEFAEVTLDGEDDEDDDASSSPTRCKCSDDDDDDDNDNDDDDANDHHHPATKENAWKSGPEEARKKSELLTKEVFLTPPLPGAPVVDEESPPTPPPAHPLTPETLIASRTRRMSLNRDEEISSPSPSPPAPRAAPATAAAASATSDRLFDRVSADLETPPDCRSSSAFSDLSACNETTRLNGTGI